jgi:hypothetical protein
LIEPVASWRDIRTEFRSIWPDIEHLVPIPEYMAGPRRPREYTDEVTFEAVLMVIWKSQPIRGTHESPYPPGKSLHRELSYWVQTGAFQKLVAKYLGQVSSESLEAWFDRVVREAPKSGRYKMGPRQVGQRRNVYFMVMFRNALEKEDKRR